MTREEAQTKRKIIESSHKFDTVKHQTIIELDPKRGNKKTACSKKRMNNNLWWKFFVSFWKNIVEVIEIQIFCENSNCLCLKNFSRELSWT